MSVSNPNQPDKSERSKKRNFASQILRNGSVLLAVLTPLLFLIGWFYFLGFYGFFHLNPLTLDLPFYLPLVASLEATLSALTHPLADRLFWIVFGSVIGLGFLVAWLLDKAIRRWPLLRRLNSKLQNGSNKLSSKNPTAQQRAEIVNLIVGFLLFLMFLAGVIDQGTRTAKRIYQNPGPSTKVCFSFKPSEKANFDPKLVAANSVGILRALVQTKELIVVFVQNKLEDGVFVIPRGNPLSVRIGASVPCQERTP